MQGPSPKCQRGRDDRKSKSRPRQTQKTGSSEVLLPQRSPGFLAMLPISPHETPSSVLSVTWRFVNTRPDLDSTENRQVEQYVGTGQLPLEVRKSEAQTGTLSIPPSSG